MSARDSLSDDEKVNAKPWNLPFWTQSPDWQAENESDSSSSDSTSDEVDAITPPSAEELENIRRQAYNDGLEQGLIEGRQKGQQEGHQQGLQQGLEEGREQGKTQGYEQGKTEGEQVGVESAIADMAPIAERLNQLVSQLHTTILEHDAQLPNTITLLVMSACEQVLKHELKTGTPSIHKFVQFALAKLPEGSENLEAQVSKEDYEYLQQALQDSGQTLKVTVNPDLAPGVCKVKSSQSLVDYSVHEHLQQILTPLAKQLLKAVDEPDAPGAEQIVLHDSPSEHAETHSVESDESHMPPLSEEDSHVAQAEPPLE